MLGLDIHHHSQVPHTSTDGEGKHTFEGNKERKKEKVGKKEEGEPNILKKPNPNLLGELEVVPFWPEYPPLPFSTFSNFLFRFDIGGRAKTKRKENGTLPEEEGGGGGMKRMEVHGR